MVDVSVVVDVVVRAGAVVVGVDGVVEWAVTVNTRTRRRSGLDHASTWAPGREWGLLAIRVRR
ncbi:MAG: hypothetical protein KGJ36_06320 [Acidobacteriota bacterium]|nr:hypothetical protein [Acidobacteriota bacterium]